MTDDPIVAEVRNGVVELDGGNRLTDGTRVRIEPFDDAASESPEGADSFAISRRAVAIGQSDLATNLDHYLYGHPKVSDEQG